MTDWYDEHDRQAQDTRDRDEQALRRLLRRLHTLYRKGWKR